MASAFLSCFLFMLILPFGSNSHEFNQIVILYVVVAVSNLSPFCSEEVANILPSFSVVWECDLETTRVALLTSFYE